MKENFIRDRLTFLLRIDKISIVQGGRIERIEQ